MASMRVGTLGCISLRERERQQRKEDGVEGEGLNRVEDESNGRSWAVIFMGCLESIG